MAAAKQKKVVGFIVSDNYNEDGKFVKTLDEALKQAERYHSAEDAAQYGEEPHLRAVAEDGTIRCCDLEAVGSFVFKASLPTGFKA